MFGVHPWIFSRVAPGVYGLMLQIVERAQPSHQTTRHLPDRGVSIL
ncbi:MAG TPA: hypothetical protein H9755_10510 [Candidatus Dietzia intestinigallinarum]|nr:hypothetical protein [Candidatus Dietzia intestinigallinarum]